MKRGCGASARASSGSMPFSAARADPQNPWGWTFLKWGQPLISAGNSGNMYYAAPEMIRGYQGGRRDTIWAEGRGRKTSNPEIIESFAISRRMAGRDRHRRLHQQRGLDAARRAGRRGLQDQRRSKAAAAGAKLARQFPPRGCEARPRWRALHLRLVQPHHRPLPGELPPSRPRQSPWPHLARELHGPPARPAAADRWRADRRSCWTT